MAAQPSVLGAHLLFERKGAVLLGKRAPDAIFAPGAWHLPAGHVEAESARACAVREAAEELALELREEDLHLVHVVDLMEPRNGRPRAQLFFRVSAWRGEPVNNEPEKCTDLDWFPRGQLPRPLVDYTRLALDHIRGGSPYSQQGWAT
ncbi:MAG TPA: NUDIX domain-containing protein [Streptomyces sp.]|jgi:8-oxo-dGTP pyrophosphatase MutT (NUDIX family)|nr:NUDIX domain-containing protein [Streptomyces sp.]